MALFRKVIEWRDESSTNMVYRYPVGTTEVNNKSKIIVRESQVAMFVHKGEIADVFPAGMYNLQTDIIPILTKLLSLPYKFKIPNSVDLYFVNTKQFTNIKWGTSNPIMMRDPEFGVVRVRGYGAFSFKVDAPDKFLKELFGTNSSFDTSEITDYLKTIVVAGITDALGESRVSALDLAGNTLEFNEIVKASVQEKFKQLGLKLVEFFVENMSLPNEVEKALDERSRLGILGDAVDTKMKLAAADAMVEAAKNPGMGGSMMGAGVGMGAGMGIGQFMADAFKTSNTPKGKFCPKCGEQVEEGAKFCGSCGSKLGPKACKFCGEVIEGSPKFCPHCGKKL